MYRLFIVTLAVVAALVGATAAPAAKPTISPVGNVDFVDGSCGFPVAVHIVADKEKVIAFDNGSVVITGTFKVTLTHGATSLFFNVSGPAFFTVGSDGSVTFKGAGAGFGPANGTLLLGHGLLFIPIDPPGDTVPHGHFVDLCPILA
jgi:hypothetical protein